MIELKNDVEITIGKCSVESQIEERQLRRFIGRIKSVSSGKRGHESVRSVEEKVIKNLSKGSKKRKENDN